MPGAVTTRAGDASASGVNGALPPVAYPPAPKTLKSLDGLPPGPNMPVTLQLLGFWYRRIPFLETCRARYGDRFTLRLRAPSTPFVVLSNPDEIKEMFTGPADALYAGDGSSELQKYFGPSGLAFMEEDDHLERRKLINKSLHGPAVEQISRSVSRIAEREVATWPRDQLTPMYPRIFRMTLEVMRHVSFGPEPDRRLDELVGIVDEMMRFNHKPGSMAELQELSPHFVRLLTAVRPLGFHRFFQLRQRADMIINEVIEERRRAGGGTLDLVGLLLSSPREDGEPFTTAEIRDEVMTTFLAGTTTTAATIAWGLERLSREDAVRARLIEEIDAGEEDAYLTATVREILRRKPPLPGIIPRHVQRQVEIGGIRYQPGVRLWASPYLVHHDPKIYPDPYAFRPERFLDTSPGTYTWIPFGGGRRRCLGKNIAELEIKTVLRQVLEQSDLRPDSRRPEGARSHIVTIYPSRGARVTLVNR